MMRGRSHRSADTGVLPPSPGGGASPPTPVPLREASPSSAEEHAATPPAPTQHPSPPLPGQGSLQGRENPLFPHIFKGSLG